MNHSTYDELNDFDESYLKDNLDAIQSNLGYLTAKEEANAIQEEREMFLGCCGSCSNFKSFMAEAGFCSISNLCLCKDPKAMIDMFDPKCEKWEISNEYKI